MFLLLVISFSFLSSVAGHAQSKCKISGRVLNSSGLFPLPGATLRIIGQRLGTATNSDGRYRLLLEPGEYRLAVSYIGFDPDTVSFTIVRVDTNIDFLLVQSQLPLPEVVVYPRSSNPADEIVRRAIRAKEKWRTRLRSYSFNAYSKTVLRTTEGIKIAGMNIAGILETQTKGYWEEPDLYKEVVTARRETSNFTDAENVFTPGDVINFNDDVSRIDRYSVPGPISRSAFDYYDFSLLDTLMRGTKMIFRISVTPKKSYLPLFVGHIDIADVNYSLTQAVLSLSDPTALKPIEGLTYDEQFAEYDDLFWLPIEIRTAFTVNLVLPSIPRIRYENTVVLYHYSINPKFPRDLFTEEPEATFSGDNDSAAWHNSQIVPLTREEAMAYVRLDSLTRSLPLFWKSVLYLANLATQSGPSVLTSVSDFYHFNRVEGSYFGVGLTSGSLIDGAAVKLIGGRGFSDKIWKYDLGLDYELPFTEGMSVGGRLFRRLANRPEENIYSRFEITLGALLYKDDYRDYYLSKGWEGRWNWKFAPSLRLGIRYSDDLESSVRNNTNYSIFSRDYSYSANPAIDDGRMKSVELSLGLDTRRYRGTGVTMQSDDGVSYWLGNASVESSSPRYLRSSFSFEKYRLNLMRHQITFASDYVDLWLEAGYSTGRLPLQRMFEIQAAYGGYAEQSVLSTLSTQRLLSAKSFLAGFEYDLTTTFFKWTGVPVIRGIWFDVALFAHGAASPGLAPMGETGFGLVNVIPFIRTDFTWGVAGLCKGFAWTLETTLDI